MREKNFATIIVMRLERLGFDVTVDDAGEAYGGDFGNIYGILRGDSSRNLYCFVLILILCLLEKIFSP